MFHQVIRSSARYALVGAALVLASCAVEPTTPPPPPPPPPGPPPVTSVSITAPATSVEVGSTLQLAATVSPSAASQAVSWSSSNETRATVSGTGLVTALTPGAVTITATSAADASRSGSVALTVTGCATLVSADVANGANLPADACYRVLTPLTVQTNTLTVGPGVRIAFGANGELTIATGGRLKAAGTAAKPITFTSIDAAGTWRGVRFTSSRSVDNVLHYVTIENGGSAGWSGAAHSRAALSLEGNSLVNIQNSTITRSGGQGINVLDAAEMVFENNTLRDNAVAAWVHPNAAGFISANNHFDTNTDNVVRVAFATNDAVTTAQTWRALDDRKSFADRVLRGPRFEVQVRTVIEAALTVAPGAVLAFRTDVRLIVEPTGSLTAVAPATDPILFYGAEAGKGTWTGLQIRSNSPNNRFENVAFARGGGQPWTGDPDSRAMVYLDGTSRAVFINCGFESSAHYALWVPAGGDITGFSGNEFQGNERAMIIHPNRVGAIAANNVFGNNVENKIRIGYVNTDAVVNAQTWNAMQHFTNEFGQGIVSVPYYVTDRIVIQAPLTIAASNHPAAAGDVVPNIVEFAQNASLDVMEGGSLRATGTADRPIIFRGGEDVNGYWKGIRYNTLSANNQLTHVEVHNAGSQAWFGGPNSTAALHVTENGSVALSNVKFRRSGGYAMVVTFQGAYTCASSDLGGFGFWVFLDVSLGELRQC